MNPRSAIAVLVLALAACAAPPPGSTVADGVKTLRVNDYDVAYVERGSGPPVILVHGSLNDYRIWKAQVEPFARKYHVYALSLRHYYPERWDGRGTDFSIRQHADDVIAFIDVLHAGPVHLVAHSRGGNVALHVAKQAPQLLKTLVLADPSGLEGLLPPGGAAGADDAGAMRRQVGDLLRAGDVETAAKTYAEFTSGKGAWDSRTEEEKQLRRDNISTVLADNDRPRTGCEEGKAFTMPVLFVNGEKSPKRYPLMSQAFARCVPNAMVATVPGASHGMFRTHAADMNRIVLEFLDRHP